MRLRPAHRGLAAALALLAGCAAGPDYRQPAVETPAAYKEAAGLWKTAQPQAIDSQHPWWTLYGDATLDTLVAAAATANQSLRQAEAQYRQARAAADAARAGFFPTVGLAADATRARTNTSNVIHVDNAENVGLTAGWEPDLWGSVRRSVEAGQAGSEASAADLAAAPPKHPGHAGAGLLPAARH